MYVKFDRWPLFFPERIDIKFKAKKCTILNAVKKIIWKNVFCYFIICIINYIKNKFKYFKKIFLRNWFFQLPLQQKWQIDLKRIESQKTKGQKKKRVKNKQFGHRQNYSREFSEDG